MAATAPITIRPLTRADLPAITDVYIASFGPTEWHESFLPGRALHPQQYRTFCLWLLRSRLATPNLKLLVAEDSATKQPLGLAVWEAGAATALGRQWVASSAVPTWLAPLERHLCGWEAWYARLWNAGTVNAPFLAAFRAAMRDAYRGLPPHLHCMILAVDPAAQGRGVGRRMLNWGLELADREGLLVTLETSARARLLYESEGFTILRYYEVEANGGRMNVPVMIRQVGAEGKRVERAKGAGRTDEIVQADGTAKPEAEETIERMGSEPVKGTSEATKANPDLEVATGTHSEPVGGASDAPEEESQEEPEEQPEEQPILNALGIPTKNSLEPDEEAASTSTPAATLFG